MPIPKNIRLAFCGGCGLLLSAGELERPMLQCVCRSVFWSGSATKPLRRSPRLVTRVYRLAVPAARGGAR